MHLTPDILEAAYELIRLTPPFKGWRLPPGDDVEFHVCRLKRAHADYHQDGARHVLRINVDTHKTLHSLTATLAHEMIHLRERQLGLRGDVAHGRYFQRMADRVCKAHGFDRGQF